MSNTKNIAMIDELASSQGGVFTTGQAEAFGVPRYALSYAAKIGHIERIRHGAYRLSSSIDDGHSELVGIWMLTKPDIYAHDRLKDFDGIAICGTTAAAIHGIGDFFLSPYQIAVPKRFNSRNDSVKYIVMRIPTDDVTRINGLPVTKIERTIGDLLSMREDRSLVADALVDAIDAYGTTSFSIDRLEGLVGVGGMEGILADSGISEDGPLELVRTDSLGHVALKRKGF